MRRVHTFLNSCAYDLRTLFSKLFLLIECQDNKERSLRRANMVFCAHTYSRLTCYLSLCFAAFIFILLGFVQEKISLILFCFSLSSQTYSFFVCFQLASQKQWIRFMVSLLLKFWLNMACIVFGYCHSFSQSLTLLYSSYRSYNRAGLPSICIRHEFLYFFAAII